MHEPAESTKSEIPVLPTPSFKIPAPTPSRHSLKCLDGQKHTGCAFLGSHVLCAGGRPTSGPFLAGCLGKSELASREHTPSWANAFSSCNSNQKRMRNRLAPLPAPPPTQTRFGFLLTSNLESVSIRSRPSQLSDLPRRAPPFSQPCLDVGRTSLLGMLWSRPKGRMAARFDPCAFNYAPPLGPGIVHRCTTLSLKGLPKSSASPSRGSGASLPPLTPGHSLSPSQESQPSIPLPSRVPGSRVPNGEPHPNLNRALSGRSVSSPLACVGRGPLAVSTSRQQQQQQQQRQKGLVQVAATEAARSRVERSGGWPRAGPGPGCRGRGPEGGQGATRERPSVGQGKSTRCRRAGACARVCVSVCEGGCDGGAHVPGPPKRRPPTGCGGGREEAAGGWGTRARSPGPAPHLPAPPPLDAEAAAAASPRRPCAPGGGREGLGKPASKPANRIRLPSRPPPTLRAPRGWAPVTRPLPPPPPAFVSAG